MLLFPLAAVVGAALAKTRGGRLASLADLRLRAPVLVWSAAAVQIWLGVTGPMAWPLGHRFAVLVLTYLAVGVWLVINAAARTGLRFGFGLLALGWLLNLAAIVPNRGMPVSLDAVAAIGMPAGAAVDEGHLGKHVEATSATTLALLGDVLPAPALGSVISIGDLVMSAGIAVAVFRSMPQTDAPTAP